MAGAAGVACVHGGCLWVGLATDWIRGRQRARSMLVDMMMYLE